MKTPPRALFTMTEAAVLTRLPIKTVNNAIDKGLVNAARTRDGASARLFDLHGLVSLALDRRLVDRFVPELRREVFLALAIAPRGKLLLDHGLLTIDPAVARSELARSLRALRRARQLVTSDSGTMGGDPVFRGTRVPVHMIADLFSQGDRVEDILQIYPWLTEDMVRLAPIYASAYPLRGRPRKQPCHGRVPVGEARRKLASIDLA